MIVPAILTNNKDKLIKMMNICKDFTSYVQIDIMDGKFVGSKSIARNDLKGLKSPLSCEMHLMVDKPLEWMKSVKDFGVSKIIFHFESSQNKENVIDMIHREGLKAGLAINPNTKIDKFKYLVNSVDAILFLSVIPGFYGSPFIPGVLDKIRKFKLLYPLKSTGIDGGVKLNNIREIAKIGIDYICVGSAIMKSADPSKIYKEFVKGCSE